jgi:RNA polymerase sigma factor (sigma-70 family)
MSRVSGENWEAFLRHPVEETFIPVYEGTKALAWTLCVRFLGDRAEAEDAFQSAYCRLLSLAADPDARAEAAGADPEELIARLAIREADSLRKRLARRAARETPIAEEKMDHAMPVEEAAARREVRERVEGIVAALPERYRLPVQLHYFHGLPIGEVARALRLPPGTIAYRLRRALGKLDGTLRRAGLGPAARTFAGIAVGAALLQPSLSAATVFSRAQALAASTCGSGAVAAKTIAAGTVILGALSMKVAGTAVAVIVAVVLAFLLVRGGSREGVLPPPPPPVSRAERPVVTPPPESQTKVETPAKDESHPAEALAEPEEDMIAGTVRDSQTGEPLAGAVVRLGRRNPREAIADAEGAYSMLKPGKGDIALIASAEGHADRPAWVVRTGPGRSVLDFALDAAVTVTVIVVDEAGAPIASAEVIPSILGLDGAFDADKGVKTNAAGKAMLPKISRLQPLSIEVGKEGFRSTFMKLPAVTAGDSPPVTITLERLRSQARAIIGRVADPGGRPIAGAVVEWKDGSGFGSDTELYGKIRASTDRQGQYRLEFSSDFERCYLGVAAKGRAPSISREVKPGTPQQPTVMNFTLEPGHWLSGRTIDDGGRPLPGETVRVMPARDKDLIHQASAFPAVFREAKTDGEGRFQLEDLPGPKAAVLIFPARGDSRPIQEDTIEVDREADIVHKGWGVIRGRAVDARSGEPIVKFNIRLQGRIELSRADPGESFSSPEGRFVLSHLAQGETFGILVEAEGYMPEQIPGLSPLPEVETEEVEVALSPGSPLEGVVVEASSGAPIAGAWLLSTTWEKAPEILNLNWDDYKGVVPDFRKTASAGDGSFRLLEGKPGSLLIKAKGHRGLLIGPERRPEYRGVDGRLRIPLEGGERLSGICYEDGKPARDVSVDILRNAPPGAKGPEFAGQTRTDGAGRFTIDDLTPGMHVLEWTRQLPKPPEIDAAALPPLARSDLEAFYTRVTFRRRIEVKESLETEAELGKDLGSLTLRGHLVLRGLESPGDAKIMLRPASDDGEEISLRTGKLLEWRFACPFLRPGKYAVEAVVFSEGGQRKVNLATVEMTGDIERDFEVASGDR